MFCHHFSSLHEKNSQNRNETEFINVHWHILYMNIYITNWYNWSFDPTNMKFLLYFNPFHDFWPPSTWKSLVHTSWGKMGWCEKRDFQLLKMRKKKISWNIKTKCITNFLLTVRSSRMKDYTCHYELST